VGQEIRNEDRKMTEQRENKRIQGFTLAELLIVVAIIAVLVAVSVPVFIGKMNQTKKTVCEANRKILVRQMVLDRMDDSDYSEADAAVVMENSDAYCPGGGKYTLEWNELYIKVTCNIHGSTSSGMDGDINVSSKFIDDYRDFTIEYLKDHPTKNNDEIRKAFLEKYNGKWPTLIVDKKSYSIQPFYQGKDKTKPVEDCVWLFARANGNADAGWSVPYVYNIVDGKWYGATKWDGSPGGAANISYEDTASLDEAIRNNKHSSGKNQWVEVTGYKESK